MNEVHSSSNSDKPTAAKMSRFVFKEAFLHPTTTFPAASLLISGLYLGVVDFNKTAFIMMLASGVLASLSFVWHYFFRFEKIVEKLFKEKKLERFQGLEERQKDLYRACTKAGFSEGAREVRQLTDAFEKLRDYLVKQSQNRPQAERFLVIASEAYKEGLGCLQNALHAHELKQNTPPHSLQTEMVAWAAERKRLMRDPERNKVKIQALTTRIESHRNRLDRLQQQSDSVAAFLAQSEVIEGALENTFYEISQLLAQSTPSLGFDSVTELEKAVAAAQRVEERLRAMEQPGQEDEAMYLDAGQNLKK